MNFPFLVLLPHSFAINVLYVIYTKNTLIDPPDLSPPLVSLSLAKLHKKT